MPQFNCIAVELQQRSYLAKAHIFSCQPRLVFAVRTFTLFRQNQVCLSMHAS